MYKAQWCLIDFKLLLPVWHWSMHIPIRKDANLWTWNQYIVSTMSDILIYFPEGLQIHVLVTYWFVICIYDLTYTICTKSPTVTTQVKSTGTTDMHGHWESHVLSQLVKPKVRPFLSSGLSCLTTVKIVDNKLDYNSCHFKHISTYMLCFIYFATKFLLWTSWPWSAVPWLQLVQWSYHQR